MPFGFGWGKKSSHIRAREAQVRSSVHLDNARTLAGQRRGSLDRASTEPSSAEAKARALFQMWDTDGNGSISRSEMSTVLVDIGVKRESIPKIFDCIDTNGDGVINFHEFMDWIAGDGNFGFETVMTGKCTGADTSGTGTLPSDDERDHLIQVFKSWDLNGDGIIDQSEFRETLGRAGFSFKVIDHLFDTADQSRSGQVKAEEFISWAFSQPDDTKARLHL
eukprot:TRINITY_DN75431_c0_g1_i1.p1 TRINITY_DN75431_c0_g1~~TRINITY_DN75431_c0_g1_i1.p1  ORF type:complete len:228 (+),score=34.65 TRINITY_DN75431_c0_g1_i1:23-685(+)